MTHQLKLASATYGVFGAVIGIVVFLLLVAGLSMYAAELNRCWPAPGDRALDLLLRSVAPTGFEPALPP